MPETLTVTRAAVAGLAGAGAVAGTMAVARRLGLTRLEFARILATLVDDERDAPLGASRAFFLANGAVLALGYRTALEIFGGAASVPRGAALGLAHGLVAAGSAALLTPLHPRPRQARLVARGRSRPGTRPLAIILAAHVVYGSVLGALTRGRIPNDGSTGRSGSWL